VGSECEAGPVEANRGLGPASMQQGRRYRGDDRQTHRRRHNMMMINQTPKIIHLSYSCYHVFLNHCGYVNARVKGGTPLETANIGKYRDLYMLYTCALRKCVLPITVGYI